jgi:hypothetical protein
MSAGVVQLAYAEAYALKAGGYRGVAQNKLTKEIARGEVREDIATARNDAKRFVFAWAGDRNMTTGTYNTRSRESWKCNYFIRSDEA